MIKKSEIGTIFTEPNNKSHDVLMANQAIFAKEKSPFIFFLLR